MPDTARWVVGGLLLAFAARRLVLLAASALPRGSARRNDRRSIAILVAARNEAAHLPALLAGLDRLDYPADRRHVVLVSDGSTDDTPVRMQAWAAARTNAAAIVLPESRGKGGALSAALLNAPATDLVVVFDADCVPAPDTLQLLSGAFDDSTVGGVSSYPKPENARANLVARYAALERWTHHLVTMAAKDRLRLDPPITGVGFAVRRAALDQVGGIPAGRLVEDVELGMALTAAGWRLRWLCEAVVHENVAADWDTFRQQRNRWGRGLLQSTRRLRTVEDLFVASGYLDRLVLVIAAGMAAAGLLPLWMPAIGLLAPASAAMLALSRGGARPIASFVGAAIVMFGADLLISVRTAVAQLFGLPVSWGRRGAA